jgi:hypothetical protein
MYAASERLATDFAERMLRLASVSTIHEEVRYK